MVPPTTFKPTEARVTRCARKGLPNHFLTILATGSHPCLPRCTLVASKIDYTARSRPDVFSPATAQHASPHYRYITPVYINEHDGEGSATTLKMKILFAMEKRRPPSPEGKAASCRPRVGPTKRGLIYSVLGICIQGFWQSEWLEWLTIL